MANAAAPVQLGNIYFNGVDIETDHAKAFFWWTIADRRNAPGAKQNLGRLDGTISRQDRARAADYLSNCATETLRTVFLAADSQPQLAEACTVDITTGL